MPDPSTSEINAALARWDGWAITIAPRISRDPFWKRSEDGLERVHFHEPPPYCADLNLIHGLEEKLTDEQWSRYHEELLGWHSPSEAFRKSRHANAERCSRALYAICPEEHKR